MEWLPPIQNSLRTKAKDDDSDALSPSVCAYY
jgi:hypothetical protein